MSFDLTLNGETHKIEDGKSYFFNADCMEALKQMPDNAISLAIVDPPYGDGTGEDTEEYWDRFGMGRFAKYQKINKSHYQGNNVRKADGSWGFSSWRKDDESDKKIINWDVAPKQEYFNELFRVSKNQIIWGGNYFWLPPTRCFLIWRKLSISDAFSMAMCEYAWTSFNENAKWFEYPPQSKPGDERFHPCQKPIALYEWILSKYAKEGDTILDTHVGSASSLIACYRHNLNYIGFEIDADYYDLAQQRLAIEKSQITMFDIMNENS